MKGMREADLPDFPIEGGCLCGAVRYRVTEKPLAVYACHCRDCQKLSGSAYSLMMPVRAEAFEQLGGAPTIREKTAEGGRVIAIAHCQTCGTRVWHEPRSAPQYVMVTPGTLDDPSWIEPAAHVWASRRLPGVELDPACAVYEGQIADRALLFTAWETWLTGR